MTREEFKKRWESDECGGNITFDDIADCVKEWGLFSKPGRYPMAIVRYKVLKEAGCINAEKYKPL